MDRRRLSEFAETVGETRVRGGPRPMRPMEDSPPQIPPSHPYANVAQSATAVGTVSKLIIPQSAARRNFLAVRNASPAAEVIFVSFDVAATSLSWLRLSANQIALFDTVVPQDNVYVVSDSASGIVAYAFSVLPTYIFQDEADRAAAQRRKQDLETAKRLGRV